MTTAPQSIPPLFLEIIKNQATRKALAAPSIIPWSYVQEHKRLQKEMESFRIEAARVLSRGGPTGSNPRAMSGRQ